MTLHRPVPAADDLDEVLAWREERTATANLVLHSSRMMHDINLNTTHDAPARPSNEIVRSQTT